MSHVHEGPLATYSSLTDKNLAGYFANTRMRKHLKKAGLVNKRGELVSENQYRLSMARKEHKKHVKNLLAQAIVHKSLDLERTRQVEIRRKLEEIAKIELVRRVRASRGRKGDEEILPYLSPRESRAASRPATASEVRYRPQSAPAPAREAPPEYEETNVIYVDEHGRRLSPDRRDQERPQRGRPEEIDTKHLYSLDSTALKKYALQLARIDQGEVSPYLLSPVPTPPRSSRGSRSGMVGQRLRVRPRTAEARSPYRERPSSGQVQSVSGSSKSSEISPKSTPKGTPRRRFQQQRFVEGTLMLHRQEPAMMHQGEVQTLCEITMKYHGPNLTLPRDQRDPTQAVSIDQQHCGGNTLTVFKENLQPADTFSFISRRHRGFPFSLSIFVDGRIDCRISTCCEYRHAKGVKLGGKMGHFSLLKVKGATPCYKCKLNSQASPRSLKRPPTFKKDKGQPEQMQEEVIVVDKRSVTVTQDEAKRSKQRVAKRDIVVSTTKANDSEDKYESDFEDEEDTKKENEKYEDEKFEEASSKSSKSSKSSSSSSSSESEPEQDDVDRNSVTHLVYEKKEEKRIIGLKEDEDLEEEKKTEKISVKDTDSVSDVNVPGRKITSYSDDEEYPDGPKYDTTENSNMATKVEKETKERQERSKRRDSSSSRSSSSSSDRKKRDSSSEDEKKVIKVPSPPAEKRKSPSPVLRTRKSSSSSSSSSDGVERRKKKSPSPVLKKKSSSSSSSSSEDEAKKGKKTPSPTEKRISPIIMEQQRRRGSQSSTSSVHISEAEEEVKKPSPSPPQSPPKSPVRSPPRSPPKSPPKSSSSSSASEAEEEKPKEKIIVARTASPNRLGSPARRASPERASSPFPAESFTYKSYAESLPSDDDRRELKRQNSVPDRFAYRRVYENEKNDIVVTATIPVNTKSPSPPLEKRKSPSPPLEKRKSPSPTMEKRKSSSSSSSSSSESEEESKKKPETQVVEAKKSKSSSSSSSSSESEHEKKVDDKPSAKPEEKKSSSSSSSSDSSSESEKETEAKKQDVAPEIDRRSPVSQVKAEVKKSSSSSSDSTSSESEAEKKVVAKPPSPKLPEPLGQVKQKDLSSSGSSSDSSSDSESESDTARTPKQPEVTESQDSPNKTVVSVDVEKQRSPSPPKDEPKAGAAKQSSSSSSSSSGSDSSDSEDEKPKKEEDKAKFPEVKAPSPPPTVVVAPTVVKPEDIKEDGKKPESSSSDDSSSGSSSSDDSSSEDEDNKKKEEEKKDEELEKIQKDVPKSESEDDKKPSTISESESDHKKISIFASESEGDNMYGGHDPDNAVEGVGAGTSYLRKIGVKPGVTHQGSVSNLLEGKEDVDLNGISLNNDQVEEVGQYIRKQSCLKTLSIRNGQMTNSQFETIADSLIQSKAKVAMLNFSLNKLGESSAEKIVELITDIPTVSILMLHGNPIGDSGVKTLVDGLLDLHYANTGDNEDARSNPDFCKLTELDLGETGLSDDGADQISRLIESNMSLKTLYMIGNKKITSAGWKKIGKALRRNTTLENLSLDFTNLGDEGLAALIVGLRDNQTLKTLDLEGTGLTEEGGKKLVELLKCNTTILDISVSPGNKISEYVRGEIRNYLGLNRAAAQPKPFK